MRSGLLSTTLLALFVAVPALACAGAGSMLDLAAPPAEAVDPTPAAPVLIGPHDFFPSASGVAAASDQPGSEPMARKNKKADKKDDKKDEQKPDPKPTGPQTGLEGAAASYSSFIKARDAVATDSEKSAALFVQALVAYSLDPEMGQELISTMLLPKDMKEDSDAASGYHLGMGTRDDLLQLQKKQYIMPGYCGGTPQKEYKDANVKSCTVSFDKEYSSRLQGEGYKTPDHAKYFITNGGSPYPRPIELTLVEDGKTGKPRWHIKNFAGLLTGVTRPEDLD